MAGKHSRLATKSRHSLRRSQSVIEVGGPSQTISTDRIENSIPEEASAHGVGTEMIKTFDHPAEPIRDRAIGCPLPEPSILNDGRLSKERMSAANAQIRADLPVMKDGSASSPSPSPSPSEQKPRQAKEKRLMLPSQSVPEHALLTMLKECNVAKD